MALEPITRQEQIIAGKALKPITRMERFLKEYGGSNASGGGSADWSQNDENGAGYVKNRTHWEEIKTAEVVAETVVTTEEDDGLYFGMLPSFKITPGDTYLVTFNGKQYSCVADGTPMYLYFNNGLDIDDENYFSVEGSDGGRTYLYTSGLGTYTVSIVEYARTVHKIDPSYLSDGVMIAPNLSVYVKYNIGIVDLQLNMEHREIARLARSGKIKCITYEVKTAGAVVEVGVAPIFSRAGGGSILEDGELRFPIKIYTYSIGEKIIYSNPYDGTLSVEDNGET